ncbi:MAG TPA: sigma-70 family RNA polymerase sigma factor [Solirubrobacteraceae bacterium]|nr:sigma-70 family RNA polymerase sigma factor [Solirubrobacteraceae bacterium]
MQSHMPLVRAIARRYGRRGDELEDLVQAGALGLVRASSRFDPDRGVAFASFAAPAVEGEIRRHLRERAGHEPPRDTGSVDGPADLAGDPEPEAESESRLLLEGGLQALDERERQIVFLRFNADMTERQIASKLGISQAHVSRLLKGALAKLRNELTSSDNDPQAGDSTAPAVVSPKQNGGDGQGDKQTSDQPIAGETAVPSRRSARSKSSTGYSGRILVRMPSELHEQLAQAAEREDLSLNRYVTQALSTSVEPDRPAGGESRPGARTLRVAVATNLVIVVVASVVAIALLVLALQRGI